MNCLESFVNSSLDRLTQLLDNPYLQELDGQWIAVDAPTDNVLPVGVIAQGNDLAKNLHAELAGNLGLRKFHKTLQVLGKYCVTVHRQMMMMEDHLLSFC